MSENIYFSSTRGKMRASGVTKALMKALRETTFAANREASVQNAKALSEARADIVEYITNLETELNAHRAQHAEQTRREYERTKLRAHQRDLLQFIDRYSMQPTPASRIFGKPENAKVFGMDFAKVEARTLGYILTHADPYYRLYEQIREQNVVRQGIA